MAKLVKVTFTIVDEQGGEALHNTWSMTVHSLSMMNHPRPLSLAFQNPANKFWESCILMGLAVKD